jgi:hypothetical protein
LLKVAKSLSVPQKLPDLDDYWERKKAEKAEREAKEEEAKAKKEKASAEVESVKRCEAQRCDGRDHHYGLEPVSSGERMESPRRHYSHPHHHPDHHNHLIHPQNLGGYEDTELPPGDHAHWPDPHPDHAFNAGSVRPEEQPGPSSGQNQAGPVLISHVSNEHEQEEFIILEKHRIPPRKARRSHISDYDSTSTFFGEEDRMSLSGRAPHHHRNHHLRPFLPTTESEQDLENAEENIRKEKRDDYLRYLREKAAKIKSKNKQAEHNNEFDDEKTRVFRPGGGLATNNDELEEAPDPSIRDEPVRPVHRREQQSRRSRSHYHQTRAHSHPRSLRERRHERHEYEEIQRRGREIVQVRTPRHARSHSTTRGHHHSSRRRHRHLWEKVVTATIPGAGVGTVVESRREWDRFDE